MIIDGHAHACGIYNNLESTIAYMDKNNIDKVILSAGESNSKKDYNYPLMSNIFKSDKLVYTFNKIIKFAVKINNLSEHIDEQNKYVYDIANNSNGRIINTYWVNPLEADCMEKLNKGYKLYNFKMIKTHQCWNEFSVLNKNFICIAKWAAEKRIPIFIPRIT